MIDDETDRVRDERRRERDHHREPRRSVIRRRSFASRWTLQVRWIEIVNEIAEAQPAGAATGPHVGCRCALCVATPLIPEG